MKQFLPIIFFFCLLFSVSSSQAQDASLFSATVAVNGSDVASSASGKRDALARVLTRVTGEKAIVNHEAVQSTLANADDYVTRFNFSRERGAGADDQLFMDVSFDVQSILSFLREANLPVWDGLRPRLLVWIAIDDAGDRYMLDATNRQQYSAVLLDQADYRGVPVLLPLMDLIDLRYVDIQQIMIGSSSPLRTAAERYNPGATMVLIITMAPAGGWQLRWELWQGDTPENQVGTAATLSAAIRLGIDWTADRLALPHTEAVAPVVKVRERWVQVNAVSDFHSYTELKDFFSQVNGVSSVQLVRISNESLLLSVRGDVSWQQLLRVVRLSSRLAELDSSDTTVLRLLWKG